MIVEFLGHGLHYEEDETCGNHICSAIQDNSFDKITFIIAFLRKTGLDYLVPFLKNAKKAKKQITFFVGIDEQITSQEALELLLELNIDTYIYFSERFIYHPKIYLFEGLKNRIITGSSNLTKAGLFYNVESSLLLDFTNDDKSGLKVLKQLKEFYSSFFDFSDSNIEQLTNEYLEQLISEDKISSEKFQKNSENKSDIHDKSKRKGNNPKIEELGNIEINHNRKNKKYKSILKVTDEYLEKWESMFNKMYEFYKDNNHCTIPKNHHNRTLYGWYRKQKLLHKAGLIPKEHLEKLKTINFYFEDGHEIYWRRKWLDSYNKLLQIYNETGDCNIKRHKDNQHPHFYISNWVALERGKYRKGKLKEWQIEKLESIGFQWEINRIPNFKNAENEWLEKLTLLEKFKEEFGNCNVPQNFKNPKYKGLGKWLNEQRFSYKKKRKILTKDKIELLEGMGVIWNMDLYNFKSRIQEMIDYKRLNGNFNVPSNYKANPSFGNYIYRLKTKGVNEEWKRKMLLDIGFNEIGTKNKKNKEGHITRVWYENINQLKKLKNPNIKKDDKEHPKLAKWLFNQRKSYRYGRLKEEQINELLKLNIELPEKSKKRKKWEDYIDLIKLFKNEFGHVEITKEFDLELFKWIKQQKINFRYNGLNREKVKLLKDLEIL